MDLISSVANNYKFWMIYFIITGSISAICGALWKWRKWGEEQTNNMKWAEAIQTAVWNSTIYFLGFVLMFVQFQILSLISQTTSPWGKAVLGIICLVLFFYSIFCLAGRGIEIIGISISKIFEINITWNGITIKLKSDK
ncbi:MAG: hypothetical protein AB1633_13990 [Elusimicrobiota bacterium]